MKKFLFVLLVVLLLLFGGGGYFVHKMMDEPGAYPGVYVNDVDVRGMSKDEIQSVLKQDFNYKTLTFVYGEEKVSYSLEELGYGFRVEEAAEEAWNQGRTGSYFNNAMEVFKHKYRGAQSHIQLKEEQNFERVKEAFPAFSKKFDRDPADATVSLKNGIQRTPSQEGKKVNLSLLEERTKVAIKPNTDVVVEIPVDTLEPTLTTQQVDKVKGIIGEFSTTFNASDTSRTQNIRLAVSRINGRVFLPGDSFSFNEITGPMSSAGGYQNAPVIVKGELTEGLGGGVCQVSTTLYNSLLYSGLSVTQRTNHSIPSAYVAIGRDATVNYGGLDLRFVNNFDYPVILAGSVSGNRVTLMVYGDTDEHQNTIISSEVVSRTPKTVKYIRDTSVPPGTQVVKFEGRDGVASITYKTINGEKKVISRDKYPMKPKEIATYDGKPVTVSAPAPGSDANASLVQP